MNKEQKEILSAEAIDKSVEALDRAHQLAVENRDIEALVVISERWATFGQKIKSFDKNIKGMIGFYTEDEEEESENE
jgi:predicted nucleic-acid-binding protein